MAKRSLMKRALEKRTNTASHHRKRNTRKAQFVAKDEWAIKAKKAWYRARSVYKLLEINDKYDLIHPDMAVVDIWCAPWSFLQAIRNIVREKPVVWVDIKEVKPFAYKNVKTIQCSIFDYEELRPQVKEIIGREQFDLITSDIAPNTTWRKDVDQYASVELNIAICEFADEFLKKGGNMILKVFKWEDFFELTREVKKRFESFSSYKPLACRDSSIEEYVVCIGKK